jgi:hypothetical protein
MTTSLQKGKTRMETKKERKELTPLFGCKNREKEREIERERQTEKKRDRQRQRKRSRTFPENVPWIRPPAREG